jgi:sugar lactone lactonase YvrE
MTGELNILATGLKFPEGPVAHGDGSVSFVEIQRGTISRVTPDGAVEVVATPGGGPNGLATGPDGAFYLCNNGGFLFQDLGGFNHTRRGLPPDYTNGRIERIDPKTGAMKRLYDRCGSNMLCGPNDLVLDGHGGVYFTDLGKNRPRGRDHGGAVAASGNICVATLVTGCITIIAPAGDVLRQVMTGDPMTTNICFGGAAMTTAYITLSGTGRLASLDWPEPGLKLAGSEF